MELFLTVWLSIIIVAGVGGFLFTFVVALLAGEGAKGAGAGVVFAGAVSLWAALASFFPTLALVAVVALVRMSG